MFLAGAASAAEPDPVEAAIHRGVELRRRGDDAQALQEFTKAYDASRSPKALAQIGLAEQALGRWVAAETHLLGSLDAKGEPWIEKNRPALQSAVETVSKHLGSLEVLGSPAGAEVRIQGNPAAHLPMDKPLRVPAGDVVVEVRQAGYRPITRTVNVEAGYIARETIDLVASGTDDAKPPPAPGRDISGSDRPSPGNPHPDLTTPPTAESSSWRRPAKWTAAGLAVVGLGVGVVETLVAVGKSKDFNSLPDNCMDGGNGHIVGGARCEQVDHDQRVATWAAAVGFGAGGVLAIAAAVLHLTQPRESPSSGTALLTCSPSISNAGVACAARW
jgi:hypothetical protein